MNGYKLQLMCQGGVDAHFSAPIIHLSVVNGLDKRTMGTSRLLTLVMQS